MELNEFERVLRIGLGRAILHLQSVDDTTPYHDAILRACLEDTAYDMQVEGRRSGYLFEAIQLTHNPTPFRDAIIEKLMEYSKEDESWDHRHVLALTRCFAEAGDHEAESIVKSREYDFLYPTVDELFEKGNPPKTQEMIKEASMRKRDHHVDYLEFKSLLDADVQNGNYQSVGFYGQWGRYASESDLEQVAYDLLTFSDDDHVRILNVLNVFTKVRFPLEPKQLIEWAQWGDHQMAFYRDQPEELIPIRSLYALRKIGHPEVRKLALYLIEHRFRRAYAVELLVENYQDGDWKIIEPLTENFNDSEEYHSIGYGLLAVFEAHPSPNAIQSLITIYNQGPCSQCRSNIVEGLHTINALPDWMRDECAHDSYDHTREMIANDFSKPG